MLYRDRIFLISLSFLFNLGYAADEPTPKFTVKLVNPDPVNPPQMPTVEFQNPYATGGDGNGNSSSDVGSNAGGSVLNFLSAVADYIKGPKPDYDQMRRDTKNQKFIECISKSGPHVAAQFYPQETAAYLQKQYEREMAEMIKQAATAVTPAPVSTPAPQSTVHVAGFPSNVRHTPQAAAQYFANQQSAAVSTPTPAAPVVSASTPSATSGFAAPVAVPTLAPVVTTPTVLSTTSLVVTSTPTSSPAASSGSAQSHSTSAQQSHPILPERFQPSDNPVKLGKKIFQPGPLPGQGDFPHGYKDQFGHYKYYTPENVAHAIESVEKGVWHGQHPTTGKHLYSYDCPKTGLQKWAETDNNGAIMNCGINEVRHTYCPTKKLPTKVPLVISESK